MTHEEKLPWELIEEILSRVPPISLVRFKTVSKKWNALFDDNMFIDNHKSTFRFILTTKSKIFSVSIDPEIVVRELTLDIPGLESQTTKHLVDYDDFLLCCMDKVAVVWNPWLNQTRMIKSQPGLTCFGIGCDSNKRVKGKCYKTIARCQKDNHRCWTILDFDTDVWTCKPKSRDSNQERKHAYLNSTRGVSLNGNMYWVAFYDRSTGPLYHLLVYDFSSRKFSNFCDLPCEKNHPLDALSLGVFKGDRFSLLKQCYVTKKIEIWVTKNKINNNDDDVVWMTFMEVSIPNLQDLVRTGSNSKPSYFIDDKRLVVCSCDEISMLWWEKS